MKKTDRFNGPNFVSRLSKNSVISEYLPWVSEGEGHSGATPKTDAKKPDVVPIVKYSSYVADNGLLFKKARSCKP